jgi:hypothetical protein
MGNMREKKGFSFLPKTKPAGESMALPPAGDWDYE